MLQRIVQSAESICKSTAQCIFSMPVSTTFAKGKANQHYAQRQQKGRASVLRLQLLSISTHGKFSLPVSASHDSVSSWKPVPMVTAGTATASQHYQVSCLPDPVLLLCLCGVQPEFSVSTVQNWILPQQVNAIKLVGNFSESFLLFLLHGGEHFPHRMVHTDVSSLTCPSRVWHGC